VSKFTTGQGRFREGPIESRPTQILHQPFTPERVLDALAWARSARRLREYQRHQLPTMPPDSQDAVGPEQGG
jgi:hypothetical protein